MTKISYLTPLFLVFAFAGCGKPETPSGKTERPAVSEGVPVREATADDSKPKTAGCAGEGCTWDEAVAYCDGKLPTVDQLQKIRASECQPGKSSQACIRWYWSSEEENASYAKMVMLLTGAVTPGGKNGKAHARCLSADR